MNKSIFLFITFFIINFPQSYALNNLQGSTINATDSIKTEQIKKYVLNIKSLLSSYKKVTKNTFGESTEGGVVNIFYDNFNFIKKIEITYYGELGKTITDYYFQKNYLVELDFKDIRYDKPVNFVDSKEISNNITKYFISDNKIIGINNLTDDTYKLIKAKKLENFISRILLLYHELDLGKLIAK